MPTKTTVSIMCAWMSMCYKPFWRGKTSPENAQPVLGLVLTSLAFVILVQGRRTSASLMVAHMTDPEGDQPGQGGPKGLYSLFWQLRGDLCAVRTDFR